MDFVGVFVLTDFDIKIWLQAKVSKTKTQTSTALGKLLVK